jgi:hypothetical protein
MLDAGFWLGAAMAVMLALGLGQSRQLVRGGLWLLAFGFAGIGVYKLVYPPNPNWPSIGIVNASLMMNKDINQICIVTKLRNTGTAIGHAEFFRSAITIANVSYPPNSNTDFADFAANGGTNRYKSCALNAAAFEQVQQKAPIVLDLAYRYRGDFGPTFCHHTRASWNYELQSLEGDNLPCPSEVCSHSHRPQDAGSR